jgi:hypothetical protein
MKGGPALSFTGRMALAISARAIRGDTIDRVTGLKIALGIGGAGRMAAAKTAIACLIIGLPDSRGRSRVAMDV